MTKKIEKMITSCTTCQRFQAKQCDTPLEKHPRPDHPWSVAASDLFDFDRGQYMVMADMYSKNVPCVKDATKWSNHSCCSKQDERDLCQTWHPRCAEE